MKVRVFMSSGLLLLPLSYARAQVVAATVPVGPNPIAIAVNAVSNKIYIANCITSGDNQHGVNGNVTVIDGATNATTTITVGVCPVGPAVNPVTNMIYVADFGHYSTSCDACVDPGQITVIDGATNSTAGIYDSTAVAPQEVAVNSTTNTIYVANNFHFKRHGNRRRHQLLHHHSGPRISLGHGRESCNQQNLREVASSRDPTAASVLDESREVDAGGLYLYQDFTP